MTLLPTCPHWYERDEKILMIAELGPFSRPALAAQAALVIRRGTAPAFMREFS